MKALKRTLSTVLSLVLFFNMTFATAATELGTIASGAAQTEARSTASGSDTTKSGTSSDDEGSTASVTVNTEKGSSESGSEGKGSTDAAGSTDDKSSASQESSTSGTVSDNTASDGKTDTATEPSGSSDTDGDKADSDKQDSASGSGTDSGSGIGSDSSTSDGNSQTNGDSSNGSTLGADNQKEAGSTTADGTASGTTEAAKSETETNAAETEKETEEDKEADKSVSYTKPFDQNAYSNGYHINVAASAGVFPDDSELKVRAITKESRLKAVREAVLSQLESEGTDVSSITVDVNVFDITVKHGEEEIQPDTANGDVTVSITRKATATELTREDNQSNGKATVSELSAADNTDNDTDSTHTETLGQKVKSFLRSVANLFTAKSISENEVVSPATNGSTADDTDSSDASDNSDEDDISAESLGEDGIAVASEDGIALASDDGEAVYDDDTADNSTAVNSASTSTASASTTEIERRVFHVVYDDSEDNADSELGLEEIDSEYLEGADGVQFNAEHFSEYVVASISEITNGSARPSIEMSSEPADTDGNIKWTVTVKRNELPVTEYADGFRVSARLYNMASATQTVHRYVDGSFTAEAYDESTESWVKQDYSDLNYTGKSGSVDNAELSWKFINNTEHAVARFTFQTNVNIVGNVIRQNNEGDYNLTPVLMDPVKLTDLGGGVAASTSCDGKIQITGQRKWVDGTVISDIANGCINVTVIAHSNGYKIGDYQLSQLNFTAGMGDAFEKPSDFKYYFDGTELSADKIKDYVTPVELDRYNNWSVTVKGFDAGDGKSLYPNKDQDHELKISYVIKMKDPDDWKQHSHSGNYLDFRPYFGSINGTTYYTVGSQAHIELNNGDNRGAVTIEPDASYGDNGYNKSSHTMQWKVKFNCMYDVNGITYMPILLLDSINDLYSISDIKYTNSEGTAVDLPDDLKKYFPYSGASYTKGQTYTGGNTHDGMPSWLYKLSDDEKNILGIDETKDAYRIDVSTPIGVMSDLNSFAKDKRFEITLVTQLTDAVNDRWASNNDGTDVALQAKMYSCTNFPTVTIRSMQHHKLLTTEEAQIRTRSTIISLASTNKRTADKSAYKYTDHSIDYEITYNQNKMALNNVVISFDMGRFELDEIKPALEFKSGSYDVKLDGTELQYLREKPADDKVNDYRPFFTYDIKDGLKIYPKDETLANAAEHKITFTAQVSDGEIYTNASHNNQSGRVIADATISASQIQSDNARRYSTVYTDDYLHLSELQITAQNVKGTVADNGTVEYSMMINKNQQDIPAGVNLKLNLSKGHRFIEGSAKLYECTVSEAGEVTQGAEIDSSKYTASCVRNDDSTSVLTVSLPEDANARDKTYILKFTCDPDVQSYESISFGIRLQCTAQFDGNDTWSKISDYKDGEMLWWEKGKEPEGAADSFWYEIKAVDADNANVGVSDACFVIEDEDGNSVSVTGVNTEVHVGDNIFRTSSAGSAVVFAKLDSSKKYYVRQVSDADDYLADNTDRVELFNKAGYEGRTYLHAYTFKQTKASWLTFTQDFSVLSGISKDDITKAAESISYELTAPDSTKQSKSFGDLTYDSTTGKYKKTISFSELTYDSTTGKYTSAPVKLRANSKLFTLVQNGGDISGYNYSIDVVKKDSEGTGSYTDLQSNIVYPRISSKGIKATADLSNTYDYPLELRVYPEGVRPDTAVMQDAVSISLENQKTKESVTYSLKDFTLSSNGRYYYKKVAAKQGQYTIAEVNKDITGYTVQPAYSNGSSDYTSGDKASNVSIANGRISKASKTLSFRNTYISASDKLSLTVSDITSSSARISGNVGGNKDAKEVYYTRSKDYETYTPQELINAYNSSKGGIIKRDMSSDPSNSFTIEPGDLNAAEDYTYYAAVVCSDAAGSILGDDNGLAKVSFKTTGRTLTYLDFSVTHYNDQYYTGDKAEHTATVEPWVKMVDDETKGKYFEIDEVFYKRKSGDNYIGSYTKSVSKAGTYGVFVTTKEENKDTERATNLWVADFTINKAELNKSLCTIDSKKAYRDAVYNLVKLNDDISGYGELSYKLYTYESLTAEAQKNTDGYYNAGTYYIGASCTGGDNVNATAKPVYLGALTITKSDYEIYLGASKAVHYGDDTKYFLSFVTDNGITAEGGYEGRYEYLFSKTIDGVYTDDMDSTGDWYIKVKVYGDANHNETLSAPKIIRLEKAKLKVSVDFVKGKAWDGNTDIADGDWGLKFERADSSIPTDKNWEEDLKSGLSVTGKAAWTSSAAGTKTFNITDIKLVNTYMHSNIDYADLYELDTENLYNQTYSDAKISETVLTAADFKVTVEDNLRYVDDGTGLTAKVEKNAGGSYYSSFEIGNVSYKLKDTATNSYSGYYTAATQAGTYGIYVTTKDEKNGVARADELYLGDMTIGKRSDFDEGWLSFIHPSYDSEPETDSGFIKLNKNVSGYGDIEVVLYTDAAYTQKAVRNADNQYDAGTYYATITIPGGSNFSFDTECSFKHKIVINKADNVIALGRPKTLYYGDDITSCVTAEAKDKSGGVEYLFSRTNDSVLSFNTWNDADTDPSGTWYVRVKTKESKNYNKCISSAVAFVLKKAPLTPVVSNLDKHKYNGTTAAEGGALALEAVDGSAATYGKLNADIKAGLAATGTFTWTSAAAGTNTVDVTDINLINTTEGSEIDYTKLYELTTYKLENQTFGDAMIYSNIRDINATDFSWAGDGNYTYDGNAHNVQVTAKAGGEYAGYINNIKVSYKLWDASAEAYTGSYDAPADAGIYGVFVAADSSNPELAGVKDLKLTENVGKSSVDVKLIINKASVDASWFSVKSKVSYGDDNINDIAKLTADISGYGKLEYKVYTDSDLKTEAARDTAGHLEAGKTYFVGVTAEDGINVSATAAPVGIGSFDVAQAVNKITVENVQDVYYGDDMSKVLSYKLTDYTADSRLVFSNSESGEYKTWDDIKADDAKTPGVIKTGTWYVKVLTEATTNYAATESKVKSFKLNTAPLTPVVSSLKSKTWDPQDADTKAEGTLTLTKTEGSVAEYGELDNDLPNLTVTGSFNWTSDKAGTDTVNVTGITLSGTHAALYELSPGELKSVTGIDPETGANAKINGHTLTTADFAVSENAYDYAGDYTSYTVSVVSTGAYADSFKVDESKVRYKVIDPATGDVTGDFTDDPTDAGTYAVFVTTKEEADGIERANELRLDQTLVINQVKLNADWVFNEDSVLYGKDELAEPDFIISGYGDFEAKLYTAYDSTDETRCVPAEKDANGHYPVGSYILVASVTGGNNIAASSVVLSKSFNIAENVATLSAPKAVMYYGDDMNTVVKVTARYGADTAKLVFARSAAGEFAAWDDSNTDPSGVWYVKAVIAETDSYKAAESKAVAFRVMKAPLNAVVSGLDSKTYDGTTSATGSLSLEKADGSAATYGKLTADLAAGLGATGTFTWTSAEAGTNTVNVTGIKLTDEFAGRYELKAAQLDNVSYGDAKINKKDEPTPKPDPEPTPDPDPKPNPDPTPDKRTHNSSRESTGSTGGSWVKDEKGWRYKLSNGSFVKGNAIVNGQGLMTEEIVWYTVNGASFAFGEDGYLQSGWVYNAADGKWYYCDENKGKQYGWRLESADGYWYYLDMRTGAMLTGWQLINGKWYFFAGVPGTATWSFDAASDKWVYDNTKNNRPYGSLYTDAATPDNFRVNLDGAWVN